MNFREYIRLEEQNTVGRHNDGPGGSFLNSNFTGSEVDPTNGMQGHPLHLPSLDMEIPQTIRTGTVEHIDIKKNPIFVLLSDGTKMYFTYDEFNRITGNKPEKGRQMTVVFQRQPWDNSTMASQIQSVTVH